MKGALEVRTEQHLKMHMVMHLLVNKIAQNSSTKRILEVELFVPLKNTTKT